MKKIIFACLVLLVLVPFSVAQAKKPKTDAGCPLFSNLSPVYKNDPSAVRYRYAIVNKYALQCDSVLLNLFPDAQYTGQVTERDSLTCGPTLNIADWTWSGGYFVTFQSVYTPPVPDCIQPDILMPFLQVWGGMDEKYIAILNGSDFAKIVSVKIEELR
jgi:hypothetical protein